MQVGAVLVLGRSIGSDVGPSMPNCFSQAMPSFFGMPASVLELLGEPILYRIIENLQKSGVGPIFLVTDDVFAGHPVVKDIGRWRVHVRSAHAQGLRTATHAALATCYQTGSRTAIVMQASKYVELDVAGMLRFHRDSGQSVTAVRDSDGPLDIAMVGNEFPGQLTLPAQPPSLDYIHRQYANRLNTPQDLRRLVQDALLQHCSIRPNGNEVRPGVWVAPTARVHPGARVMNPAFVGAHTQLRSGVVITRCTNVEHHCEVDRGSVVENATILPHTYLGSSLDVSHSIVNRHTLVDVRRVVEVEIADRSILGSTSPLQGRAHRPSPVRALPSSGPAPWQKLSNALSSLLPRRPMPSPASVRFSYNASQAWPTLEEAPRAGDSRTVEV
jgi:NDP-sugar pyrophosphorylase family protein